MLISTAAFGQVRSFDNAAIGLSESMGYTRDAL